MFDLIKQQVNLLQELEKDLSVTFRLMGDKNWVIDGGKDVESCPFCNHHDCFRVHYSEGDNASSFYKCFSCGEYGDVITWRSKQKSIDMGKAARELAQEHNIKLPNDYSPIQQVFNLAASYYQQCLIETCNRPYPILNGRTPMRYQTEVRKHSPEIIQKMKVGFSDGGLISFLESLGIDSEVIKESGLMGKKGGDFLPANTFIYPHYVKDKVSHFTFKDPLKRVQYQVPKKFSLNSYLFYGQDTFDASDMVFLVEGENDRISVSAAGAPSVLAIIGQISGEQLEWLREKGKTKRFVTIFDPDEAGDGYREKVEVLRKHLGGLVHVRPPEDKDIDEHLANGANFAELVKNNRVEVTLKPKALPVSTKAPDVIPWEELTPEQALATAVKAQFEPEAAQATQASPEFENGAITVLEASSPVSKYTPPAALNNPDYLPAETEEQQDFEIDNCPVIQARGCYYRVVYKDGEEERIRISNFTVQLLNVYEDETRERHREIVIHRQNGHKSDSFLIDSETKVTGKLFKVAVAKAADCEWLGTQADLDNMWRLVYSQSPDHTIKVTRQVGRNPKHASWLFKNVLITDSGATVTPDENGVFWLNVGKTGLKAESLSGEGGGGIPEIITDLPRDEAEKVLESFVRGLSVNLKDLGPALLATGWAHANVYSDAIFKAHGGMGLLMFWGIGGQGKSTMARWIQSFFGLRDKMASTAIQQLRGGIGFMRKGAYYSSMPLFLDELRADDASNQYLGMIRSWYDREGRTLANKDGFGVMDQKIVSTLMIAGEDLPADPATRERCIMIRVPRVNTQAPEMMSNYKNMEEVIAPKLSGVMFHWIRESCEIDQKIVIDGIRELDQRLVKAGCSNRISKVWATAAYFGNLLCQKYFPEYDFMKYLVDICTVEQTQQRNDSTLSSFLESMEILHGMENSTINSSNWMIDGNVVHIWYPSVFREVIESTRERSKWSKNAILRALKEEPYFVSDDRKISMGLSGTRRTVITLDLAKCPEPLRNMASFYS